MPLSYLQISPSLLPNLQTTYNSSQISTNTKIILLQLAITQHLPFIQIVNLKYKAKGEASSLAFNMAAIAFPQYAKSLTASTGTTYSYVSIPASSTQKPTVLLLHGFPSSCYDWRFQIAHFTSLGYGIIAPDLLGYGSTDRPSDPSAYRSKKMAQEIIDILDAEGFNEIDKKVHGISHDWGVFLMSRLCNFFPKRWESATFISVAYAPPGRKMDIDAINAMTKKIQGWEVFGYWKFFERQDAGDVVKDHVSLIPFPGLFLFSLEMDDIR
jgi:pimeloyl-ACP methyl ester carboxylesterase